MTKRYTVLGVAAVMAVMSLAPVAPIQVEKAHAAFADLSQAGGYQTAVQALTQQNVLAGYSDHAFKPDQPVKRAELAKMIVLALDVETKQSAASLHDVTQKDWYYSYAQTVVQNGLLAAQNGSFHPNAHVTVDELITAVAKAAKLAPADLQNVLGNVKKAQQATRGQAAQLVYQVQQIAKGTQKAPQTGQEMAQILSSTDWQGTRVYDKDHHDLTKENANFIGLAKYDAQTARYEFFDAKTGKSRGDKGTFFITNDGKKRILISESMNYQAVVDMIEINKDIFTYKRMGKDASGNNVEVFVEHVPFKGEKLSFTDPDKKLDATTGDIVTKVDGDKILGSTLWNGTKVVDENGNDVTAYNTNFISLAKFDEKTNKYEFFNLQTGEARGDYGYFDIVHGNKIRAHVSIGERKYGAVLELTEINQDRFTYKRMGKDKDGKDITVFVEHEPYQGAFKPEYSF
ncbi:UNVERIFIED_CONTAM: hypothetical protein ABID98_004169 [Brevibacillus sp. OAP136]